LCGERKYDEPGADGGVGVVLAFGPETCP